MVFTPRKTLGLALGGAMWLALLALDAASLNYLRLPPPSLFKFLAFLWLVASVPALVWLGYAGYGLLRARYVLSQNALVIDWGWRRDVIPLGQITAARRATDLPGPLRLRALQWPGYAVGQAAHPTLGAVDFLATTPPAGMVLVAATSGWYALSPADPTAFLDAFAAFHAQGAAEAVEPEAVRRGLADWRIWRDHAALTLLLLTAFSLIALVGYLSVLYPHLPPQIALHFDARGQPNRFGPPEGLFLLPVLAGLVWLTNTLGGVWLYRQTAHRAGAYLLFSATALVHGLVWLAALGLLTAGR
jgi:hypothetical protein